VPVVVANISEYCISNLVCEAYGHPAIRLYLAPFHVRSLVAPPWPMRAEMSGPLAHTYAKYTLPALHRRVATDPKCLSEINSERTAWRLPPVSSCIPREEWVVRRFALFPDWYCSPAEDWPGNVELVGFPLPGPHDLDTNVREWLKEHPSPLVFTPGTSPTGHVDHFFDQALLCCRALGVPGVLLSPRLADAGVAIHGDVLRLAYVELGALMRHSALLIHHGGIGTTARALEAGIPQIVSPLVYDQPDNAERVRARTVGDIMTGECSAVEASRWMSSKDLLGELTYFYVNNFTQSDRQLEQYRQSMLAHARAPGKGELFSGGLAS